MSQPLNDVEYEATLARIRDWVNQSRTLEGKAQQATMERAAEMVAVYEDKRWVKDIPPPKNKVWRGRPVDPESFNRFSGWLLQQTGLKPGGARNWKLAHELVSDLLPRVAIKPSAEYVVRPLLPLRKIGYEDQIQILWRRAVDLAGGEEPTAEQVKQVVSEFRKEIGAKTIKRAQSQARIKELREIALDDLKKLYELEGSTTAQQVIDDFVAWANQRAGVA
jgi:hypothetical protein